MTQPDRVRFLPAAVDDMRALHRKDPQIVRDVMKKVLLINANPQAGLPLGGALTGYRKIVVGDRHWRIIWRITTDGAVEIAEVWAVGARKDNEVYAEITARTAQVPDEQLQLSLTDVVEAIAAARSVIARARPREALPDWLHQALVDQVGLPQEEVESMTPEEANSRLAQWYARPRSNP